MTITPPHGSLILDHDRTRFPAASPSCTNCRLARLGEILFSFPGVRWQAGMAFILHAVMVFRTTSLTETKASLQQSGASAHTEGLPLVPMRHFEDCQCVPL